MTTLSEKLRALGIEPVGFSYTVPSGTKDVANPMFTHYSWLWRWLDQRLSRYIDEDDRENFWRRLPQLPPSGWNGPAIGIQGNGAYLYAEYGTLHLYDNLVPRFQDAVVQFPDLIRRHAAPNLTELYLDNLAEYLKYIDPAQLPEETQAFIASREG